MTGFPFGAIMQKPFYAVFLTNRNIPRKKYLTLASAITDAYSISKNKDRSAYILEFTDKPLVLCICHPDGTMELL